MMRYQSLTTALLVIFCVAHFASTKFVQVNPDTHMFVDEFNRTRIFHGVNVVYKKYPFYPPERLSFNANSSLCDEDFKNLKSWGFNVIRLYLAWQAFEPQREQYNTTYLDQIEKIVQQSASYGIQVILDVHQDVVHPKFCGEGFPDWAVIAEDWDKFPYPVPVGPIERDANGIPLVESCLKNAFFQYYLTEPLGRAIQNFYNNQDGIRTSFAKMWGQVARRFQNNTNLLGYEILNEPWAGNIYQNPLFLVEPGKSDKVNLYPLYNEVHLQVRQSDNNHILFYEPMVADYLTVGLPTGPSRSEEYLNREAFSYHIYCADVDSHGDPRSKYICSAADSAIFSLRVRDIHRLRTAGFLTEFGALSDSVEGSNEIARVTGAADDNFQSWAYWQFKFYEDITTQAKPPSTESFYNDDGSLQTRKVRSLSRTYAQAICGVPTRMNFNPDTSEFNLEYSTVTCGQQPTIIYLNEEWYYANGFSVTATSSSGDVKWASTETNYLEFHHSPDVNPGSTVTINITRK